MPIHLADRRLVKRLLAGEEQAFNQFFEENFGRLYRFVIVRAAQDDDATAEIVQSTLARALRSIHGYRGEAALFTWLCTIARNEVADWVRRNSRYREHIVLTEDGPEIKAAVDSILAPVADEPVRQYQQYELTRLVQVALDRLPPRYGDALEWKYIHGYSVKEIATKLELSFEATQSLLARAKRAFHDVYGTLVQPVTEEAGQ